MRTSALAALVLVAGATLAGCSSAVPQADVEDQISSQYEKQIGTPPDDVSCPEDLNAEKGATMTCQLTDSDGEYDVKVTVTSVEGDTANFDIEVLDPEA